MKETPELEYVEALLRLMRKYGARRLNTGKLYLELSRDTLSAESRPAPDQGPLPFDPATPTMEELLFHSSPLGPPDGKATPPPCVACGGEQGLSTASTLMCYACGDWDLMPKAAQDRYPGRKPNAEADDAGL